MSDKRYIELHKEAIRNIISPLRRQISLSEMIHDAEISESMRSPQPALVISKASKVASGQLEFGASGYVLHVKASKLSVTNNQSLIVVFKNEKREYFVQARTKEVYADRINLAPINPRFYHRIGLKSTATVTFFEKKGVDRITSGELTIRRCELSYDEKRKIHYFARDSVKGSAGVHDLKGSIGGNVMEATMVDLSRGGCALTGAQVAEPAAAIGMVGYLETSVKWGKKIGNYSCLIVIKSAEFDIDGARLRCSFLEPLTFLPNALVDAAREFKLEASGAREIIVNGSAHPGDGVIQKRLPMGTAVVDVVSNDGRFVRQFIEINEKSDQGVIVGADDEVKSA